MFVLLSMKEHQLGSLAKSSGFNNQRASTVKCSDWLSVERPSQGLADGSIIVSFRIKSVYEYTNMKRIRKHPPTWEKGTASLYFHVLNFLSNSRCSG